MRPHLLLCLCSLLLLSCGAKKTPLKFGEMTKTELLQRKGEPVREETIPAGRILIYEGEEKYQLNGEIVTAMFRDPSEEEKPLLYWKHQFKDCQVLVVKIEALAKDHSPDQYEMRCHKQGLSVIYTEGSSTISRVVSYESK